MKKIIFRLTILAALAAVGYGAWRALQQLPERQAQIATTKVRQDDVIVRSYTRGELRAVRSVTLTAPNLFGTVQVTRLAPLGALAREKDLVIEFDDSEVQSRLEEKQLEIDQVDEQIKKAEADLAVRNNQDQVDLLKADFAVRRAKLEVDRNELLSKIDAQKNELTLKESVQRQKQLQSDVKSRLEQAQASLAVLRAKKNKSLLELARERQRLLQVKLLSPITGLVAIRQNRGGGFFFAGMQIPDIREGDQLQPGMQVADVLDLSELEVIAKVGELDRANLKEDQDVLISLDAIPEKKFRGKIKSMSGTATASVFANDPQKKFDVVFSIDMRQLLSALGAKPEQVARILATAEQNRKKPVSFASSSMGGMFAMGGGPAGGGAGAMGGGNGGGQSGPGGEMAMGGGPGGAMGGQGGEGGEGRRRFGGGGSGGGGGMGRMMADLTPEQQQKMRDATQKILGGKNPMEMPEAERQAAFTKLRAEFEKITGKAAPARGSGGQQRAGGGASGQPGGATPPAGGQQPGGEGRSFAFARPGGGQQAGAPEAAPGSPAAGGGEGGGGRGGRGGGGMGPVMVNGFSEKDLSNAKLPPPPEEDSQLDVLIRPGLLVDIEIIVEKIPNAIHVPTQAVFDKDGKMVVYVKHGNKWDERGIKPFKRSESTMVIAEGVKPGEVIAMADPTARKGNKKDNSKGGGGAGAMGGMPSGGGGGGGGGPRGGGGGGQ
jgi:multidrug resistance efflux pump